MNLKNGWYRVPGDGAVADPNLRPWNNGNRYYFWAFVRNGKVTHLLGNRDRDGADLEPEPAEYDTIKKEAEELWGQTTEKLLEPFDSQPAGWGKVLAGVFVGLLGVGAVGGFRKRTTKPAQQTKPVEDPYEIKL